MLLPGDRRVLVEQFAAPAPGIGEVVVRIKASAICRSDYQSVMRELNAVGYSGYVTMETGFHARTSDPDQIASDALRYRKAVESSLDR